MKKALVVIKLGGSVITDKKTNEPIFKRNVVKRICREIYQAKKKLNFNLIIVHGAGSFGHPSAKKYRLNEGYIDPKTNLGITITKRAVLKLNNLMLDEIASSELNSCLVESSAIIKMSDGKIKDFNLQPINDLLEIGIIPLLSGDVAFDYKKGISIVSGDAIVSYLSKYLKADKVIFASDVDGIFDKNPKVFKGAKLIAEINKTNYKSIIENMQTHNLNDVTGEMKGKVLTLKENLMGIDVYITNGLKNRKILDLLFNRMNGTRVHF